jgi:hypothetical protein
MGVESFFSQGSIIIEGSVVTKKGQAISIQIHPGLVVDVQKKDVQSVEESTHEVTGRALTKVTLKSNADAPISAVFQPKIMRLALGSGVPFTAGGTGGDNPPPPRPGGGGTSGGSGTAGTFNTTSYNQFWGYQNDDVTYHDW